MSMVAKSEKAIFNNQKIRWGILGTARIARKRMIKAIQLTEGNECTAIASRELNKAKNFAKEFNIPKFYGCYSDLLNDNEVDAVYIALPNSHHYQWVVQSAENGKHILCEKPLSYIPSEAKQMIDICLKNDIVLMEAHSYFLHPQYLKLFELLKADTIGRINQIQIYFSYPAKAEHGIRFSRALGGGSLLDIGCYGVDFINRIFDQDVNITSAEFRKENDIDTEFTGIFKMNTGIEILIRSSFIQNRQQTITINGDKGSIFLPQAFIPSDKYSFVFVKKNNSSFIETIENLDQYSLLVKNFKENFHLKKNLDLVYNNYIKNSHILNTLLNIRENN